VIAVAVVVTGVSQTVVRNPWVGLGVSLSSSISSWLGISGSFAVITVGSVTVVTVSVWVVGSSIATISSIAKTQTMIAVAVVVTSIAQTVVVQPRVGLGIGLSISLSSGLGLSLSLLYRHDGLLSSLGRGGGNSEGSEGREDSMSTGDQGTLIVPTAGSSSVDQGDVVVGQGEMVVHQGASNSIGKLGVSLSGDVGSDS